MYIVNKITLKTKTEKSASAFRSKYTESQFLKI